MVDNLLLDLPPIGGFDEIHVLQQVRHAGLAVAFVTGAHQVGDVDGHLGVGLVGIEQHAQPVGERVFRDASHGGFLLYTLRQGLGKSVNGQCQSNGRDGKPGFRAHRDHPSDQNRARTSVCHVVVNLVEEEHLS